jgi:hypothetical protein
VRLVLLFAVLVSLFTYLLVFLPPPPLLPRRAHPTATKDESPAILDGDTTTTGQARFWENRAYHMPTSSYCMRITTTADTCAGGVFRRGDASCDVETVQDETVGFQGEDKPRDHVQRYIDDAAVLAPHDDHDVPVPKANTSHTAPWPNCHYMMQAQNFDTLDAGKWWKEGFRVSVVPIASTVGGPLSAFTEEAYPFLGVLGVVVVQLVTGSLYLLWGACRITHPYPTLGFFIARRHVEKQLMCRCCPALFLTNVMALLAIGYVVLGAIVLMIYKAATGSPIPPHVLVLWALTIMTIVLQSGKLWQPTDEDMYADGALLGTRGVAALAQGCANVTLKMGLADHLSLSSKDALKRVETAMLTEALAEHGALDDKAKEAAREALSEVFATAADVAAFRKVLAGEVL